LILRDGFGLERMNALVENPGLVVVVWPQREGAALW
jgi:hypothetical protein